MLEHLIDIIDKLEEILGIEGAFISSSLFREKFSKYLSSTLNLNSQLEVFFKIFNHKLSLIKKIILFILV